MHNGPGNTKKMLHKQAQKLMHKLNKLKSIVGQPGSPVNLSLGLGHRLRLGLDSESRVRLVCAGSMRIV